MYSPNKLFLFAITGFCFLIKILPSVLSHFGMDIRLDNTYPWTFTPIFAVGLFGLALFRDVRLGFLVPLLAFLAGDLVIGLIMGLQYGVSEGLAFAIYPSQVMNYFSLIMACSIGLILRQVQTSGLRAGTLVVVSLLAPILFFLSSNLGVWAFDIHIGYPKTLAGLKQCYLAGLPFLKNSVISTLFYSALLFSPLGISQLKKHQDVTARSSSSEPVLER